MEIDSGPVFVNHAIHGGIDAIVLAKDNLKQQGRRTGLEGKSRKPIHRNIHRASRSVTGERLGRFSDGDREDAPLWLKYVRLHGVGLSKIESIALLIILMPKQTCHDEFRKLREKLENR